MVPFLGRDRVRSMRRGGIHAARKTMRSFGVAGAAWRLLCLVGRAFTPAEHYKKFLKNYRCGGVKTPLQCGVYGRVSRKPRVARTPCREACMPPLQIRVPRTRTENAAAGQKGRCPCGPGCRYFAPRAAGAGPAFFILHFSFGQRRRRQPLTAPAMKPCSKYFCTKG